MDCSKELSKYLAEVRICLEPELKELPLVENDQPKGRRYRSGLGDKGPGIRVLGVAGVRFAFCLDCMANAPIPERKPRLRRKPYARFHPD